MSSQAMNYELTGTKTASKQAVQKAGKNYDVRKMSVFGVLWFEVSEHWVGLLATVGVLYMTFDNFGTLIIGLTKSLFN